MSSPASWMHQEWKAGNHTTLGKVRAYEPKPPPRPEGTGCDPAKYPLTLARLDIDPSPSVKGWQKFRLTIPSSIRARHIEDPVYGQDWKTLLADFDSRQFVSKWFEYFVGPLRNINDSHPMFILRFLNPYIIIVTV